MAYHRAVIDATKGTLMPAIKNAEPKALVENVAAAFQGHLAAAKKLPKNVAPAPASASGR